MAVDELHKIKRGVSILATCLVETLNESDPTFRDRFLATLTDAYYRVRDSGEEDIPTLELINWTRENLTGFNHITGQGAPFFD